MRVITFQPRFEPGVLDGTKLCTMRKRAGCKAGDVLSLRVWSGKPYRSKQREIGRRICKAVKAVSIWHERDGKYCIAVDEVLLRDEQRDAFARADGFEGLEDMVGWLLENHGPDAFKGWLIEWGRLELPETFGTANGQDLELITMCPEVDGMKETQFVAMRREGAVGRVGVKSEGLECATIRQLWVHPDLRGQGIGRRLVEACVARARECGCCTVNLSVHRDNIRAAVWYGKLGFILAHVFEDGEMLMARPLGVK
jgi:ribosomal protein S18 acetylase RimI-like enzyme